MSTVVFVHGTGVRQPRYADLLGSVTTAVAGVRPDVQVHGCYWGEQFGARLAADGASVPETGVTRGIAVGDDVSAWWLLYLDPTLELRDATTAPVGGLAPPGMQPPGQAVVELALSCGHDPNVIRLSDQAGLPGALAPSAAAVCAHPDAQLALADPLLVDALPYLFARAIVADAVNRSGDGDPESVPVDGFARDDLVAALAHLLAPTGSGRSVPAVVTRTVARTARLAWRLAGARAVERRRRVIVDAAHPLAGDVLVYLAHGAAIRSCIAEQVWAAGPEPVTLLAHSLGGVASVDLLVEDPDLPVAKLITVGSQAPLLYEIGALPSLVPPTALPAHFPPWFNLYDPRDLLAFVAAPVFPGRVRDAAVDSRQPFPSAHSAYWQLEDVARHLAVELP